MASLRSLAPVFEFSGPRAVVGSRACVRAEPGLAKVVPASSVFFCQAMGIDTAASTSGIRRAGRTAESIAIGE
jgi:hypothetical protein